MRQYCFATKLILNTTVSAERNPDIENMERTENLSNLTLKRFNVLLPIIS